MWYYRDTYRSITRTGWMEGWENRPKGMTLATILVKNPVTKTTKKKLLLNQILKWDPFPSETFITYMDALASMPEVMKVYHDALVTTDDTKSEDK